MRTSLFSKGFLLLLCLGILASPTPAPAENQAPPPPAVTLTLAVSRQISPTEYELTLDMSAEADCHVKISLFLPPGAMVTNPNLYIPRPLNRMKPGAKPNYEFQLFLGPLQAGANHTFTLPVKLSQAFPTLALAQAQSLMAPFGVQEQTLTLGGEA